ncbi:hypothetical protein V6N13_130126 [Hibiscus sabdariffa]
MMKPSWIHTKREVLVVAVETIDTVAKTSLVEKSINTIKFLVIDAVEKVNSGHPGLPMGCALNPFVTEERKIKYVFVKMCTTEVDFP